MKITEIRVNHLKEPLGFQLTDLRISFKIQSSKWEKVQKKLIIYEINSKHFCWQSSWLEFPNNYFDVNLKLKSRQCYRILILVRNNQEIIRGTSFFETGKMTEPFKAFWIGHRQKNIANTLFRKKITIKKPLKQARGYLTGLGVYEAYIDGKKIGNEYLAPGVTAYDQWVQVQTYDLTNFLTVGKHELLISCGDGWYKGNYGFDGGKSNIYGDQQLAIGEYHLEYQDGTHEVILTDKSWQTTSGPITKSSIYYGEDLDQTIVPTNWQSAIEINHDKTILKDRLSLPLKIKERLDVIKLIITPKGEQVLDFGQNQAGWLEFYNRFPRGTKVTFEFGEVLQKGNFYRKNLRLARAAFVYNSDGKPHWVHPHFTYFGYRYVKITGNSIPLNIADFKAAVIFSDINRTGKIITNQPLVNRLFDNVIWGQKSNFFDVPTDCPQRDERLGWTGDAEIFCPTAAYNFDVYAFFKKYSYDLLIEQKRLHGKVPMYAPSMGQNDGGTAVWGDAATIIPWVMYQMTNDPAILRQNFEAMISWVEWITKNTQKTDLWIAPFQFGDWLALDAPDSDLPFGKTDSNYIASIYYYYSSWIVGKTAQILHYPQQAKKYLSKAQKIKEAIQAEYITPNGRLALDTQTGYILALQFDLVKPKYRLRTVNDLVKRIHRDHDHLTTGFVGTPYLCRVLSRFGQHELAIKLFLNTDYPSWLYEVKLGATTIWERWNSILPNGSMNPDGMNSLNHYSMGAVMDWAYQYILGIGNHLPGFSEVNFAPQFDYRISQVEGSFNTPYGDLKVAYALETDAKHTIKIHLQIPFGLKLKVTLPRSQKQLILVNQKQLSTDQINLNAGNYELSYQPTEDYLIRYRVDTPIGDILKDQQLVKEIAKIDPILHQLPNELSAEMKQLSISKLVLTIPKLNISSDHLQKIEKLLQKTYIGKDC